MKLFFLYIKKLIKQWYLLVGSVLFFADSLVVKFLNLSEPVKNIIDSISPYFALFLFLLANFLVFLDIYNKYRKKESYLNIKPDGPEIKAVSQKEKKGLQMRVGILLINNSQSLIKNAQVKCELIKGKNKLSKKITLDEICSEEKYKFDLNNTKIFFPLDSNNLKLAQKYKGNRRKIGELLDQVTNECMAMQVSVKYGGKFFQKEKNMKLKFNFEKLEWMRVV